VAIYLDDDDKTQIFISLTSGKLVGLPYCRSFIRVVITIEDLLVVRSETNAR